MRVEMVPSVGGLGSDGPRPGVAAPLREEQHRRRALVCGVGSRIPTRPTGGRPLAQSQRAIGQRPIRGRAPVRHNAPDMIAKAPGTMPASARARAHVGCSYLMVDLTDTETRLLAQIARAPRSPEAYWSLVEVSRRLGHTARSMWALERLRQLSPRDWSVWSELGTAYAASADWDNAAHAYRRAVALGAVDQRTLVSLAVTQLADDRVDEARVTLRSLQARYPDAPAAHLIDGHIHKAAGALQHAATAYRQALAGQPDLAEALYHLVELDPEGDDTGLGTQIDRALAQAQRPDTDIAYLNFAQAQLHDRARRFQQAFASYRAANEALRRVMASRGLAYDAQRHEEHVSHIIAATLPARPESAIQALSLRMRPIFVIGMPRSGTTLVDQIIGRHPLVQQGGEMPIMPACVARFLRLRAERGLALTTPWGDAEDLDLLAAVREFYLESALSRGLESECFTDKLPANFENVGLIRLLFPNAVIVHCRRHPVATCWSLYTANLVGHDAYHTSLDDIAHFYRQYRRLMHHWTQGRPAKMVEVDYETLVADPDHAIPKLIAACELPWHRDCQDFERSTRPVVTASASQVRRAVHTNSVSRWMNYRDFLGPLASLADQACP